MAYKVPIKCETLESIEKLSNKKFRLSRNYTAGHYKTCKLIIIYREGNTELDYYPSHFHLSGSREPRIVCALGKTSASL